MKRIFYAIASMCLSVSLTAQTIVSTQQQNRNTVLEEFTGIYCTFCPDGHAIANAMQAANPDRVVLINVHSGGFAQPNGGDPDFRTQWGEAIDVQANVQGYPAGTINREVFPGLGQATGSTAMSRGNWNTASTQILAQPSIVNIAATAEYDVATSVMDILVEIYYTGSSAQATNRLNIAILQDDIVGPQTGGGMGSNYVHKHMLRDLVTGQWGETINTTTAGHFESRTYSYTVPAQYNNIPVEPGKLKLAVFITETQQKIYTGIEVTPSVVAPNALDARLQSVSAPAIVCDTEVAPSVSIRNDGSTALTSLDITYSVNGGSSNTYTWTGNLATLQKATVELPAIAFSPVQNGANTVNASISAPNGGSDEDASNNAGQGSFDNPAATLDAAITVEVRTDNYGLETYWEILDENENIVSSGGNQQVAASGGGQQNATAAGPGAYGNAQVYTSTVNLPGDGCYTFRILDDYGDGICCSYGQGYYHLKNADGSTLIQGGEFGVEELVPFRRGEAVSSIDNLIESAVVDVFPNPVQADALNVRFNLLAQAEVSLQVQDVLGRVLSHSGTLQMPSGLNTERVDVSALANGTYILVLNTPEGMASYKFIIAR